MQGRFFYKLGAPVLAGLLLAGCGGVKIGRIISNPAQYHNKDVKVQGKVTQSVGAVVAGIYQVEDETGKIHVLSNRGVPSKGSRVEVKGMVNSGITVMGRSFGTVIRERDHKLKEPAPPQP